MAAAVCVKAVTGWVVKVNIPMENQSGLNAGDARGAVTAPGAKEPDSRSAAIARGREHAAIAKEAGFAVIAAGQANDNCCLRRIR